MLFERCDEFPGGAIVHALARQPLAFGVLPHIIRDIAHAVVCVKEQFEVGDEVCGRAPRVGSRESVETVSTVIFDGVIPIEASVFAAEGSPAAFLRHLDDSAALDGSAGAVKAVPLAFALAGMIAFVVPGPVVPYGAGVALLL